MACSLSCWDLYSLLLFSLYLIATTALLLLLLLMTISSVTSSISDIRGPLLFIVSLSCVLLKLQSSVSAIVFINMTGAFSGVDVVFSKGYIFGEHD